MILNWRGKAAKLHAYYDQGRDLFERAKGLLVIAAALKILGLPLWALGLLAPVAIVGYILLGWWWLRRGWYRQLNEVAMFDRWTPMQVWDLHMKVRMLAALGVQMNGYDPTRIPEEVEHILASRKTVEPDLSWPGPMLATQQRRQP